MTLYQNKYRIESARLPGWDYRSRGWYFVTICTHNRANILGQVNNPIIECSKLGVIAESELRNLSSHYRNVEVPSFVVMPNHVHMLVAIEGEHCFSPNPSNPKYDQAHCASLTPPLSGSLSAIVRSYKAGVTRRGHEAGWRGVIWQSRFYDHLVRGDANIAAVKDYIRNNPANWSEDKDNLW